MNYDPSRNINKMCWDISFSLSSKAAGVDNVSQSVSQNLKTYTFYFSVAVCLFAIRLLLSTDVYSYKVPTTLPNLEASFGTHH